MILLVAILFCLHPGALRADQSHYPLEPPDNSSPRATIQTFLDTINKAVKLYRNGERPQATDLATRAALSLDLESTPPAIRGILGFESVIYLKEILDRIELPPLDKIPDKDEVKKSHLTTWTIPHTEINLAARKVGETDEKFLFTKDTVENLEEFFNKVKLLPYRPDSGGGALAHELITSSGFEIINRALSYLPESTKTIVHGQTVWQWVGLAIFLVVMALAVIVSYKLRKAVMVRIGARPDSILGKTIGRLIMPLTLVALSKLGLWFILKGLHMINVDVYFPAAMFFLIVGYIGAIWCLGAVLSGVAGVIINVCGLGIGNVDAQLIRFGFELVTVGIILAAIVHLGSQLGLPTYSLVGGLGISGIAIALAGREALSNLIGTVVILLDHPFKMGDYITLGNKTQGTVLEIGLRSTRIITLDGLLISVPNAQVANMEVINQSAPSSETRISVPVGVAYGSVVSEVEKTLLEIASSSPYAAPNLDPVVRFDSFGDSSLNFELLMWIARPEIKKVAVSSINRSIYEEFEKKGIEIPFPRRDVHILSEK